MRLGTLLRYSRVKKKKRATNFENMKKKKEKKSTVLRVTFCLIWFYPSFWLNKFTEMALILDI